MIFKIWYFDQHYVFVSVMLYIFYSQKKILTLLNIIMLLH